MNPSNLNTSILRIKEFYSETILGVYDWEKLKPRPVLINADIWLDTDQASSSDDISHTIDYAKLVEQLDQLIRSGSYNLIETLAEDLANYILNECASKRVKIEVIKPDVLKNVKQISICIKRQR